MCEQGSGLRSSAARIFAGLCLLVSSFSVVANDDQCIPESQVLLPASKEVISYIALVDKVKNESVVLLGEHHDNMEHHRWQLQTITGLHLSNPNLALGFEMFPRGMQPVLDSWVAGELTREEFLSQSGWAKNWSFDPDLYMLLFQYARMNKIPMYALNVERSFIQAVGDKGWDDVPSERREGVTKPAPATEGYKQMLAGVFAQHGAKHGQDEETMSKESLDHIYAMPMFQRFVMGQQVWDRAMAQVISKVVQENKPDMFIGVMGSGHMMNYYGVPEQLADLGLEKPSVLIPWDPEFKCSYISETFADAIIGLVPEKMEPEHEIEKPRLGVYLEATEKGVLITRVAKESLAEALGMQKDDLIVSMAGRDITTVEQVIELVQSTQWGTWLPLAILREDERISLVAKFSAQN